MYCTAHYEKAEIFLVRGSEGPKVYGVTVVLQYIINCGT